MIKNDNQNNVLPFKLLLIFILTLTILGCKNENNHKEIAVFTENELETWNKKLTDVMISDIFTPPVASRIYAYTNIAAYAVMGFTDSTSVDLSRKLNNLKKIPKPDNTQELDYPIASIIAFSTVGKVLVYNQEAIEAYENDFIKNIIEIGIDEKILDNSIAYGKKVGNHILDWSKKDGYHERSALPRYQLKNNVSSWKPTPPDYMEAIEPNWNTLRTFVLDSVNQFSPEPPTAFDTIPSSQFYKEALVVYHAVKDLSEENLQKAKFWDCNPNVSHAQGHIMYYTQQMSPGGHWMMIACQVIKNKKLPPLKASKILSQLAITISDAFKSSWSEKYKSCLIRPEIYINKYIDLDWNPILQTPAFPEYTSAHSVASASAATILTYLLGESYKFVDSAEVPYGLPTRSFNSFKEASEEAAISRLYGGIHYMPAIINGLKQGRQIGNYIVSKLNE